MFTVTFLWFISPAVYTDSYSKLLVGETGKLGENQWLNAKSPQTLPTRVQISGTTQLQEQDSLPLRWDDVALTSEPTQLIGTLSSLISEQKHYKTQLR